MSTADNSAAGRPDDGLTRKRCPQDDGERAPNVQLMLPGAGVVEVVPSAWAAVTALLGLCQLMNSLVDKGVPKDWLEQVGALLRVRGATEPHLFCVLRSVFDVVDFADDDMEWRKEKGLLRIGERLDDVLPVGGPEAEKPKPPEDDGGGIIDRVMG